MAKIVIAGHDDCPYYARAELLGDQLAKNLPDFKLHKIVKTKSEWEGWLKETCLERGWETSKSPIIWRELLDRGGKGVLIGGANEFQEYVNCYYGINSNLTSIDMRNIAEENSRVKAELDQEEAAFKAQSKPLHVCIAKANSPVAYHLINYLASGETFGPNTEITLRLFDEKAKDPEVLLGLKMEAEDLCQNLLRGVTVTSDPHEAFKDCSSILLLDNLYQKQNESRQDWLKRNVEHYTRYAKIINETAKSNVKVLLANNNGPVNLCATMMIKHAPNIPRQNIVAMSKMVENYAKSVIGDKLSLNTSYVLDLIVWGNINTKTYIDLSQCKVTNYNGAIWGPPSFTLPAVEMIHDNKWIEGEYPELLKNRKQKVEEALKHPSSVAFSSAIITMLQHWWNGTPKGQLFSLGVCSEGWYGVPEGLVFSFPITMNPKGYWNLVQDIEVTVDVKSELLAAVAELQDEIEELTRVHPPETSESKLLQAGDSVLIDNQTEEEKKVFGLNEEINTSTENNKNAENESKAVDENNSRTVDENESKIVDENESKIVDENESKTVDEIESKIVDENESKTVDESESKAVDENTDKEISVTAE